MLKAYRYRIYPTDEQKNHFVQAMGCVRYLYNKGLEAKTKHYETTGKSLSCFDMINGLLMDEKRTHEWLKQPTAQSLQMPFRQLDNAFQRFFKKTSGFPAFKKKSGHGSVHYPQDVKVDFKRSRTKLMKVGEVFTRFDRKFTGTIKTCTVSKTPTNKFYVSILVEDGKELPTKKKVVEKTSVGIDLGIKHFATLSSGEKIDNPKFLRQLQDRLAVLQGRASKKTKGSKNRSKANLKAAKIHEKISFQRTDFLQKLSSKIISENQTVILEDLGVKNMMKNHKLARSISDASWSSFTEMLKYKAEWQGKNVIQIGRFDPSSKMCSKCGQLNQRLLLSDREWTCSSCNMKHDRDVNAAINIKKFGLVRALPGQVLPEEPVETPVCNQGRRSRKPLASC